MLGVPVFCGFFAQYFAPRRAYWVVIVAWCITPVFYILGIIPFGTGYTGFQFKVGI